MGSFWSAPAAAPPPLRGRQGSYLGKRNRSSWRDVTPSLPPIFAAAPVAPNPPPSNAPPPKRPRPVSAPAAVVPEKARTGAQQPSAPVETQVPAIDATPDGEVHRYKVNCPAMYYNSKKETVRILKRVDGLPPYVSVRKISKWDHFMITFPNPATAAAGVEALSKFQHKGEFWWTVKATASAKSARAEATMRDAHDEQKVNSDGVCRTSADVTAPLRDTPYHHQLVRKSESMTKALQAVTRYVFEERFPAGALPWADVLKLGNYKRGAPVCCPFEGVLGADGDFESGRDYYRNKNEFTVGFSPSSCGMGHTHHVRQATVGYSLGLVSKGEIRISPITVDCRTTSEIARKVSEVMTDVVRRSNQTLYDKTKHSGYWRQVMVRNSDRTKLIIVVPMTTSYVSHEAGAWTDADCRKRTWEALNDAFDGTGFQIGLFWQVSDDVSAPQAEIPSEWYAGVQNLEEEMCGLRFRVHANSFFQVNTVMAERLYGKVGELAGLTPSSVLLDICCGTGTIGLSLAHQVHSVIGVELCEDAVVDARHNAKRNSIENATFFAGRVEDKIREVLDYVPAGMNCVAILDPPRCGVHNDVLIALRKVKEIKRIVYVACEPKNIHRNSLALCRPASKAFTGAPFAPVHALGVDLFPHTPCGELVVKFER